MRRPGALLGLAALALLVLEGCRQAPKFDNVVVVLVDTLRSDHLPSYGYERDTAPYLARLAAEGIQLQGYAVTSWTKPSVATLLTGLEPQRHQAISRSDKLPPEAPYLPEILAGQGVDTAAFVGNLNVGQKWGFDRGFRRFEQWNGLHKVDGPRVTERALQVAKGLQPPYFLFVHYVDPHDPYRPRQPWGGARPAGGYVQPQRLEGRPEPPTPGELQGLRDQYDGEIREVDREIERLVKELTARGLMERTLLVVTADHGEEFGEHGGLTHGHTLYEEVLRVPFLLWSRQGLPHRKSSQTFYLLDFAPTMIEAMGKKVPPGLDGIPRWAETVAARPQGDRELFFHLDLEGNGALALISPHAKKLVHTSRPPFSRLTDLVKDPREQTPPQEPGRETEETMELLQRLAIHHNHLADGALERRTTDLDPRLRRSLAALGYLQVDDSQEELEERVLPVRISPSSGMARVWEQRQRLGPMRTGPPRP
ncbi:MAG TPA: sulfatase [Thermoanaerobaculia bacterium]|nr:sulfatase [Thermoanaerobaculia bacterium]